MSRPDDSPEPEPQKSTAGAEAAETLRRQAQILEQVHDAVVSTDMDGVIETWNAAAERLLGYSAREAVGREVGFLTFPEDRTRIHDEIFGPLASQESHELTVRNRCKNGDEIFVALRLSKLRDEDGTPIGLIGCSNDITERRRAEEALLASDAALRRSHQEIQDLADRLLSAQEEERSRLSRELHDDLYQRLAALAIEIGLLKQALPPGPSSDAALDQLHQRAVEILKDVRHLSRELHPAILDHLGLEKALASYCRELEEHEGLATRFSVKNDLPPIPLEIGLGLYRIVQEGLRNVVRHSGVQEARVTLIGAPDGLRLAIADAGAGFEIEEARGSRGIGLRSMEERARLLGGRLEVRSRPGLGTELKVRISTCRQSDESA